MNKYSKVLIAFVVSVCALGAGRAYYSSIEGLLAPGVIRAYPAVVDDLYTDGTASVRISIWSGAEVTVRIRIAGINPTDTNNYIKVLSSRVVNQSGVFVQTAEQFDQSGTLFGTIFYSTNRGYRDVAMDLLDAQCAIPSNVQAARIVPAQERHDIYQQEEPRRAPPPLPPSCRSGKIDGKRFALDILGSILNK
jgi:hypothetical protein